MENFDKQPPSESNEVEEKAYTYKEVTINGETIRCKKVNMLKEYEMAFEQADSYRKTAVVTARQATKTEEIATSQDGMINYAEPGDWIIHNPGDQDPYVFGSKNDSLEVRQKKFSDKYDAIPGKDDKFQAKGVIKAVKITENIVFETSWGKKWLLRLVVG